MGDIEITKDGKIFQNGIERKGHTRKADGYIVISVKNKLYYTHRLVAEKYIPNPYNLPVINHKDGNTSNNNIDNLEWTTKRKNCEHARLNGLSDTKLQGIKDINYDEYTEIKRLYNEGISTTEIGKKYNRHRRSILSIIKGERYKDYKLKYELEYELCV